MRAQIYQYSGDVFSGAVTLLAPLWLLRQIGASSFFSQTVSSRWGSIGNTIIGVLFVITLWNACSAYAKATKREKIAYLYSILDTGLLVYELAVGVVVAFVFSGSHFNNIPHLVMYMLISINGILFARNIRSWIKDKGVLESVV